MKRKSEIQRFLDGGCELEHGEGITSWVVEEDTSQNFCRGWTANESVHAPQQLKVVQTKRNN